MVTTTPVTAASRGSYRERLGGVDTPAAIGGLFAALGMLLFMGGLVAAGANELAFQIDTIDIDGNVSEVDWVGFAVAAAVIFIAFFFGGWVAGRMARVDGAINGVALVIWFVVLTVGFAVAGAYLGPEYNVVAMLDLPDWVSQLDIDERTTNGIIAAIVTVVVALIGAVLGGRLGEVFHLGRSGRHATEEVIVTDRVVT